MQYKFNEWKNIASEPMLPVYVVMNCHTFGAQFQDQLWSERNKNAAIMTFVVFKASYGMWRYPGMATFTCPVWRLTVDGVFAKFLLNILQVPQAAGCAIL